MIQITVVAQQFSYVFGSCEKNTIHQLGAMDFIY